MALPGTPKAEAALALAAALAAAADNARCAHAVWSAGARVAPLDGAAGPPDAWASPAFDSPVPPADEILRAPPRWRRNGIRVFISDLLWPSAPEPLLQRLAGGAAALNVVQLLAAEEVAGSAGTAPLHRRRIGQALDVFVDDSAAAAYRRAWPPRVSGAAPVAAAGPRSSRSRRRPSSRSVASPRSTAPA